MNILFGDNHVQTVEIGKKSGDALRYHPGIKNLIENNPVIQFPPKNVTVKKIYIDIIEPNFTTFTVGFLKYLKSYFSWMAPRKK